jgi:amidohydrolase
VTGVEELKSVRQTVDDRANRLVDLSLKLHANVEFSLQEVRAQSWLCDLLDAEGFAVERGLGSLPTAFRGTAGTGTGPTIAFLCEYDGLAPYGHSCGHNVVAAAGVGAGIGLKSVIEQLGGTVVVLGTPGEEGGGGKYILRDEGFFGGIDAMMLVYPGMHDIPDSRVVTAGRGRVEFFGEAAHAAARPELGVNALDAMLIAFTAVNALRQQLPSDTRVHWIITKGGTLGNVIPDHTSATISVRANNPERVAAVVPRVRACFEGAAIATGCRVEHEWSAAARPALLAEAGALTSARNQCARRRARGGLPAAGVDDGGPVCGSGPVQRRWCRIRRGSSRAPVLRDPRCHAGRRSPDSAAPDRLGQDPPRQAGSAGVPRRRVSPARCLTSDSERGGRGQPTARPSTPRITNRGRCRGRLGSTTHACAVEFVSLAAPVIRTERPGPPANA